MTTPLLSDPRMRAMRQRILGSHTPPCHRCMVITTQFNERGGGAFGALAQPRAPPPLHIRKSFLALGGESEICTRTGNWRLTSLFSLSLLLFVIFVLFLIMIFY